MKKATKDMIHRNLESWQGVNANEYCLLAYNKGGERVSRIDCVQLAGVVHSEKFSDSLYCVHENEQEWLDAFGDEVPVPAGLEFPILETRLGANYEPQYYAVGQWPTFEGFVLEVLNRDSPANNYRCFATVEEAIASLPEWESEIREAARRLMD